MADDIKRTFEKCKTQGRNALVTFVTAGYPTLEATVGVLKAMQEGGTDIIELGLPFTDPLADGPTIQESNDVSLANGTNIPKSLELLREARRVGVTIPIILMGYYNPLLIYGEERVINAAKEAGANGFIVVDLPPEEALTFRDQCRSAGLSYIPLVAPATSNSRLQFLAPIADTFIYVVSRMGVTGSSASAKMSASLPELCARVRKYADKTPIAVGFGVNTREHFLSVGNLADGVVIGSKIVSLLKESPPGKAEDVLRDYCKEISRPRAQNEQNGVTHDVGLGESIQNAKTDALSAPTATVKRTDEESKGIVDELEMLKEGTRNGSKGYAKLPSRFGEFGGQYVPESLFDCLVELEEAFVDAINDSAFWEEFQSYYPYMNRPSMLQFADRLTNECGGAKIWLKREDLNHTGSHKVNNAVGQALIAKRLGKTRVIAETGAGQHGVATATVAAKFGLKCTVFMGGEDVRRQALNVFRMKLLGAEVISVETGSRTLRDAVNEALRHWVTDLPNTHYIIGSAIGPHPFPTIVRTFQSVIGSETKDQLQKLRGKLPDAVVACVGGGSNASGMFYPFSKDLSVRLLGVEAGGDGIDTLRHSATLSAGTPGVLHGVKTYLLQNAEGQISDTHSVSAGLDYSGVGPELSYWKSTKRATFVAATDAEALKGFRALTQLEGIIPALESSHAVFGAMELAKTMGPDEDVVICLSGRGDKDVQSVAEELPRLGPGIGWDLRF